MTLDVFWIFLRLGLTSFGGPVAHIGYFRSEFVERRRWLDEESYASIVGFCQFLPGPASSQVAMALGQMRAGAAGLIAAFIGFTLPSALLMALFAFFVRADVANAPWVHGLKLAAVAVVAQALWSMTRTLTPDAPRLGFAAAAFPHHIGRATRARCRLATRARCRWSDHRCFRHRHCRYAYHSRPPNVGDWLMRVSLLCACLPR